MFPSAVAIRTRILDNSQPAHSHLPQVPQPSERKPYHTHRGGNFELIVLDSGHYFRTPTSSQGSRHPFFGPSIIIARAECGMLTPVALTRHGRGLVVLIHLIMTIVIVLELSVMPTNPVALPL